MSCVARDRYLLSVSHMAFTDPVFLFPGRVPPVPHAPSLRPAPSGHDQDGGADTRGPPQMVRQGDSGGVPGGPGSHPGGGQDERVPHPADVAPAGAAAVHFEQWGLAQVHPGPAHLRGAQRGADGAVIAVAHQH